MPRAYNWNYICDERDTRLASSLAKSGIRYVDLRENLANIPGTIASSTVIGARKAKLSWRTGSHLS